MLSRCTSWRLLIIQLLQHLIDNERNVNKSMGKATLATVLGLWATVKEDAFCMLHFWLLSVYTWVCLPHTFSFGLLQAVYHEGSK